MYIKTIRKYRLHQKRPQDTLRTNQKDGMMAKLSKNTTQHTDNQTLEDDDPCPVNEKKLLEIFYKDGWASSTLLMRKFKCTEQTAINTIAWLIDYFDAVPISVRVPKSAKTICIKTLSIN